MRALSTGFLAALMLLPAARGDAAGTKAFRHTTIKDFEEGEAQGSQILPSGDVVPGWKTVRFPSDAGFLWSAVASPDGATAYFGAGDPGRVLAMPLRGGDREGPRKVADVDAPWVTALAMRADGSL